MIRSILDGSDISDTPAHRVAAHVDNLHLFESGQVKRLERGAGGEYLHQVSLEELQAGELIRLLRKVSVEARSRFIELFPGKEGDEATAEVNRPTK